ncbi:hypothetical protein ACFLZW_05245 [Chloroflexota bacterium]
MMNEIAKEHQADILREAAIARSGLRAKSTSKLSVLAKSLLFTLKSMF